MAYQCDPAYHLNEKNVSIEYYKLNYSEFYYSSPMINLNFVDSLVRDVLCLFILVPINIMTIIFIAQTLQRKKAILNNTHSISKMEKVQTRTTLLVLASSFLTFIGHVPYFIYTFIIYFNTNSYVSINSLTVCSFSIAYPFLMFMPMFNFLIYLFFLKEFRKFFKKKCFYTHLYAPIFS